MDIRFIRAGAMDRYFLARRCAVITSDPDGELRDTFKHYACLDCDFVTEDPQEILDHQREWHNWRTWWRRFKDR